MEGIMSIASQNKTNGKFQDFFRSIQGVAACVSGRIEVLGNYTAYNEGLVLSTATDKDSYFSANLVDEEIAKDNLILCDFREFSIIDKVKFSPDYLFVIVDSMVNQEFVESDYKLRRESCERAVECIKKKYPRIKALRDVSSVMLKDVKNLLDLTDYKRASHIVSENDLALKCMQALKDGDIERFGSYLYLSNESSRNYFENSCHELDYLVELSKSIPGCVGAKLSGLGFGGISIHVVKKEEADRYSARIATAFKLLTNTEPQIIVCGGG